MSIGLRNPNCPARGPPAPPAALSGTLSAGAPGHSTVEQPWIWGSCGGRIGLQTLAPSKIGSQPPLLGLVQWVNTPAPRLSPRPDRRWRHTQAPMWLHDTANTISTKMAAPRRVTLEELEGSICRTPFLQTGGGGAARENWLPGFLVAWTVTESGLAAERGLCAIFFTS